MWWANSKLWIWASLSWSDHQLSCTHTHQDKLTNMALSAYEGQGQLSICDDLGASSPIAIDSKG